MIERITITRISRSAVCTLGLMVADTETPIAVTLERPWLGNRHDVSCIPPGEYTAQRYRSPKRGYDVLQIIGVPDRSAIEVHIGNYVHDTDGCVLVGLSIGALEHNEIAVMGSRIAFDAMMRQIPTSGLILFDVRDSFPITPVVPA